MKVADTVKLMSKTYLHRIIDSLYKDLPKRDEETSRDTINKNLSELAAPDQIKKRLHIQNENYSEFILRHFTLEYLLNQPDTRASESEIADAVRHHQQSIIESAANEDVFKYADRHALDVFQTVLEVAIEDSIISQEELALLRKLRNKLRLNQRDQVLLLARANCFPKPGNQIHTLGEIKDSLKTLEKSGTVFFCNRMPGDPQYVIPDELRAAIKEAIGFQLSEDAWRLLLEALHTSQLKTILSESGIPTSGSKAERIDRIVHAQVQPDEALDYLANTELYDICKRLPGAAVSGSKPARISRIIDYFSNLVIKPVTDTGDKRELYYQYYAELASRDRENLLANKVISKDIDIERAFEEGTRYIFEKKFGLSLEAFNGNEHADGGIRFTARPELFLWDNKSKETVYKFPEAHAKQFRRYIQDAPTRVSCFLIIAPQVSPDAAGNAAKLKIASGDTDIALISAEDLKWVAESWKKYSKKDRFNLDVFNTTGILDQSRLEMQMKLFL